MAKSLVGAEPSPQERKEMLNILERVGRSLQLPALTNVVKSVPVEIKDDKEKLARFLLLVALLDQQAKSPTALVMAQRVYDTFGDLLFSSPVAVLVGVDRLAKFQDEYKISPAIGRVLPRFAWIVLRVGTFLIYEMMLNKKKLSDELGKLATPYEAADFLGDNIVLAAVLREKARFMYISWVGHPDLGINISNNRWRLSEFLMPVDGHVGKVFSRTGIVKEVMHEGKLHSGVRWNIIQASNMRLSIQMMVSQHGNDCIMVDHGAFRIGFNCCPDNLEGIACDSCSKLGCEIADAIDCQRRCPIADYCKRNLTWRAY